MTTGDVSIPSDYGLPYPSFRIVDTVVTPDGVVPVTQLDVASQAVAASTRFVTLQAPTGVGKSLICYLIGELLDQRRVVTTMTKQLQDQIAADMPKIAVLKGKSNYDCRDLHNEYSCAEGKCNDGIKCQWRNEPGCDYYDAERHARREPRAVTNAAKWLSDRKFNPDNPALGSRGLLIIDEAHNLVDELSKFTALTIRRRDVERYLPRPASRGWPGDEGQQRTTDKSALDVAAWTEWSAQWYPSMVSIQAEMAESGTRETRRRVESLCGAMRVVSTAHDYNLAHADNPYVKDYDAFRNQVSFTPLWPASAAEDLMFQGIEHVVLTSATLPPATTQYLGIEPDCVTRICVGQGFEPARRPFYYHSCGLRLDGRLTPDGWQHVVSEYFDPFAQSRLDHNRRGIVQALSYARAKMVKDMSSLADQMIIPERGESGRVIESFKRGEFGPNRKILVSPGTAEEGVDFAGDAAYWQWLTKLPRRPPTALSKCRDAALKKSGQGTMRYSNFVTARDMQQIVGRVCRSETDYGETIVFDDHFSYFVRNGFANGDLAEWFLAAYRIVDHMPAVAPL